MRKPYKWSNHFVIVIILCMLFLLVQKSCGESFVRLVKHTEDKVVKIGMVDNQGREGIGSGAYIDSQGTILTCEHLFRHEGIVKIFVKEANGNFYRAEIIKRNEKRDLALIRGTEKRVFTHFLFGHPVEIGQQVLSFGSPLGHQGFATIGWVENIAERTNIIIFHSAFVNPGNSGGPLVDLKGRLVGINEAVILLNPFMAAQGMFVAIDVESIKEFLGEK